MAQVEENRRPLKTRRRVWPHRLAHLLVRLGVTPNQISAASVVAAALGAVAYAAAAAPATGPLVRAVLLIAAAVCIQLRLLSNLLDGLMAVEEGRKTPAGALYNEIPDRLTDSLFLVAAGHAAGVPELGWAAALLAVLTAYVRALGGALGCGQDYSGPMAKQQRMFVLTAASVLAAVLPYRPVITAALALIALGSAATVWRRIHRLAGALALRERA